MAIETTAKRRELAGIRGHGTARRGSGGADGDGPAELTHYLAKPFTRDDLKDRIAAAARRAA